ncbi:MAG: hypothetical protein DUD34_15845, partial [Lactobacillus sp.]
LQEGRPGVQGLHRERGRVREEALLQRAQVQVDRRGAEEPACMGGARQQAHPPGDLQGPPGGVREGREAGAAPDASERIRGGAARPQGGACQRTALRAVQGSQVLGALEHVPYHCLHQGHRGQAAHLRLGEAACLHAHHLHG